MKFGHILHALHCEPWLINAEMHAQLCEIVDAHVTGKAHAPGGSVAAFAEAEGKNSDMSVFAGVAQIGLTGVVGKRIGMMEKSSGVMDVDDFTTNVQSALDNDQVRGILIDVNSPGGTITGVPEAADMITEAAKIKPIVAFTDTLMASAAYWIASGADAIVATQSASVGSVGVFSSILDSSMAFRMQGLENNLFKTGPYKGMGTQGVPVTQDQKNHMQERVEKIFDWFKAAVVEGRGSVMDEAFGGQAFRGVEAKDLNLIDVVGSRDDAFAELFDIIALKK